MVNLHSNQQASTPFTPTNSGSAGASGSSSPSSQTLASEISEAFAQILQQFGIDPNSIKLTVNTASGQTSGASQNSVTDSTTASTSTTPASASSQLGFNALVQANIVASAAATAASSSKASPLTASSPTASTSSSSSGSSSQVKHWYADNAVDDAYWSKQPAAVQQLREIDDLQQRQALGAELASKGYTIDNTIMVWGWDAGKVATLRQSFAYTWVPAATQANVTAAPGLTGAGITPYDPNNPPAGSISVPSAAV